MNLNSVERVQEYTNIPSERYHPLESDHTSNELMPLEEISRSSSIPKSPGVQNNWPSKGEIEFKHIYMKYASANEFVLRCDHLNCHIWLLFDPIIDLNIPGTCVFIFRRERKLGS